MKYFILLFLISLTAQADPDDLEAILYAKVKKSITLVRPIESNYFGGTGFQILTPKGRQVTVTAAHVCITSSVGWFTLEVEKDKRVAVEGIEFDSKHDLCILAGARELIPLKLATKPTKTIYLAGVTLSTPLSVVKGKLLKIKECRVDPFYNGDHTHIFNLQLLRVYTKYGNSGAPILDPNGEVVGVMQSKNKKDDYDSAAVTLEDLTKMLTGFDTKVDAALQRLRKDQKEHQ